jgi:hypothetical protein
LRLTQQRTNEIAGKTLWLYLATFEYPAHELIGWIALLVWMRAIILAKQLGDMGAHQLSACPKKKMRWYGQVNTSGGRTFAQALLTKPRRAQTRQLCGLTVFAF